MCESNCFNHNYHFKTIPVEQVEKIYKIVQANRNINKQQHSFWDKFVNPEINVDCNHTTISGNQCKKSGGSPIIEEPKFEHLRPESSKINENSNNLQSEIFVRRLTDDEIKEFMETSFKEIVRDESNENRNETNSNTQTKGEGSVIEFKNNPLENISKTNKNNERLEELNHLIVISSNESIGVYQNPLPNVCHEKYAAKENYAQKINLCKAEKIELLRLLEKQKPHSSNINTTDVSNSEKLVAEKSGNDFLFQTTDDFTYNIYIKKINRLQTKSVSLINQLIDCLNEISNFSENIKLPSRNSRAHPYLLNFSKNFLKKINIMIFELQERISLKANVNNTILLIYSKIYEALIFYLKNQMFLSYDYNLLTLQDLADVMSNMVILLIKSDEFNGKDLSPQPLLKACHSLSAFIKNMQRKLQQIEQKNLQKYNKISFGCYEKNERLSMYSGNKKQNNHNVILTQNIKKMCSSRNKGASSKHSNGSYLHESGNSRNSRTSVKKAVALTAENKFNETDQKQTPKKNIKPFMLQPSLVLDGRRETVCKQNYCYLDANISTVIETINVSDKESALNENNFNPTNNFSGEHLYISNIKDLPMQFSNNNNYTEYKYEQQNNKSPMNISPISNKTDEAPIMKKTGNNFLQTIICDILGNEEKEKSKIARDIILKGFNNQHGDNTLNTLISDFIQLECNENI